MTVSIIAMLFDIKPVLVAAILSALTWNYFFIPPLFTLHIGSTSDILIFALYFVIAFVNAVLTSEIRRVEKRARLKEERENTILLYNTLLNSLSHELRTPISTIVSSIDALKENANLSEANKKEVLNQMDLATDRLNKQVENLLSMSRLESGTLKLNYEWVDVNDLMASIVEQLKATNAKQHFEFNYQPNFPLCYVDIGLMEQVIYNILYNATLYTPEHTVINISMEVQNQLWKIIITDNGHGIPKDLIEQIFNKFYRLPHSKTGGTGLGLSISKGFVEAHGGTISAENIEPQGLKFIIQIPTNISYINNLKNE